MCIITVQKEKNRNSSINRQNKIHLQKKAIQALMKQAWRMASGILLCLYVDFHLERSNLQVNIHKGSWNSISRFQMMVARNQEIMSSSQSDWVTLKQPFSLLPRKQQGLVQAVNSDLKEKTPTENEKWLNFVAVQN